MVQKESIEPESCQTDKMFFFLLLVLFSIVQTS